MTDGRARRPYNHIFDEIQRLKLVGLTLDEKNLIITINYLI